ncbi:uncharacterized protein DSM5745_08075 [Aspergillus mulundensis]|uniref:Uncharacterized protein n=1 Tax=Aspergillus mulundensis TaxID=1810919 RepID=A0A3D8R9M7_9EURO|nr:Uncharacterized protein DSM5745_08075 [Aspergillus mulundensis]RDW70564.1 Uncharacterized protein DSM5745_08075 [Aspergillus mulundensis]
MYALVANSFKTTPAVRRILPCSSFHSQYTKFQAQAQAQASQTQPQAQPQSNIHSTAAVDQFYMSSSFPDDVENPPTMTQRRTSVHATPQWRQENATDSEAGVKADRGEAAPEDTYPGEENEPTIDEM